jgi:hypothetical protein
MPYFTPNQVLEAAAGKLNIALGSVTDFRADYYLAFEGKAEIASPDFSVSPPLVFDIFLSHSSLDSRFVLGIYTLLQKRGYSVYLDRVCDPNLNPKTVTRDTARILRYRMAQSRSLFVCTSENISKSQWVPWELGFGDGWKNGKAAILPITDSADFGGQEYFEVYPEIRDAGANHTKPNDLDVWEQKHWIGSWGTWVSTGRRW